MPHPKNNKEHFAPFIHSITQINMLQESFSKLKPFRIPFLALLVFAIIFNFIPIKDDSLVISFIGALATFIVVTNYAQMAKIENSIKEHEIKHIELVAKHKKLVEKNKKLMANNEKLEKANVDMTDQLNKMYTTIQTLIENKNKS